MFKTQKSPGTVTEPKRTGFGTFFKIGSFRYIHKMIVLIYYYS